MFHSICVDVSILMVSACDGNFKERAAPAHMARRRGSTTKCFCIYIQTNVPLHTACVNYARAVIPIVCVCVFRLLF